MKTMKIILFPPFFNGNKNNSWQLIGDSHIPWQLRILIILFMPFMISLSMMMRKPPLIDMFSTALVQMFPSIVHLSLENMSLGHCQVISFKDEPLRGLSWLATIGARPFEPAGPLCPMPGVAQVPLADVINDNQSMMH